MTFLRELFGPSQSEIWGELAKELGGQFEGGGLFARSRVDVKVREWVITLDTFTRSHGKTSTTYTRLRAPYINRDGLRFKVVTAGVLSGLAEVFGTTYIKIGDAVFDNRYVINGNDPDRIRVLFGNQSIQYHIMQLPSVHIEIKDDEGWFGPHFPDGVDELYFEAPGTIKNIEHLKTLYTLFAEILDLLCRIGSAYENAPFEEHDMLTLVRGASPPPAQGDELLRATMPTQNVSTDGLLRPVLDQPTEKQE